jgi:hypothetical protein
MSEEMTYKRIRKKFDAKASEIKEEYERKTRDLEAKIVRLKKQRDARLIKAEKQFRKDFSLTLKWVLGQEDYSWLSSWLVQNKEKEMQEAEKRYKTKNVNELKEMSMEDYLFYYLGDPRIEGRLRKEMKQSRSQEAKRLSLILTKLKLENLRLERTRI